MSPRVFTSYGRPLALDPRAFGMVLLEPPAPPEARDVGNGVHIVDVRGPLMHHADTDPFCDSYDAIKARVLAAIDANARTVVLSIDSPGGLVSGCFDTSDEIRAACDARGVRLLAYVDGQATSAAYALACVAEKVFVPSTGIIGSIGVIDGLIDATAADASDGIRYTLITSGARKADGNPHSPTTDGAVVAAQARVDSLASIFFDHVASRRGISAATIAGFQAGLFHGAQAVGQGLADAVLTLDQVLSYARGAAEINAASAATETESTMDDNQKARAALQAIIDGDGSSDKEKSRARAALAAMDSDEDEAKAEGEKEPDGDEAEGDGEPDGDEPKKKDEEAKAAASADAGAQALAMVREEKRARLMAARPDLTASQRKDLAKVPVEALEYAINAIPRAAAKPAATAGSVSATRGESQGDKPKTTEATAMNVAMGLASNAHTGVRREGSTIYFHALTAKAGDR